jgi:hypothetical protein
MNLRLARLLLFLGMIAGTVRSGSAQTMTCPATIVVGQELKGTIPGWEPITDDIPQRLSYVTFYDGPPKEKASLVYDSSSKQGNLETALWRFAKSADRPIWLACSYSGTTIALAQELPRTISSCTVTYNAQQRVAGMPLVEKIVCK